MASTTVFTYGPANVDSLLATTKSVLAKTRDFLNDAIFTTIPVLKWLEQKAQVKRQGGASILVPLLFGKNTTFKAYSKDDTISTTGQEGLTLSQWQWRNYAGTISVFGDEVRQNAGEGKLFDLVKAKTLQAQMSARDTLAIDIWASSQATKAVTALPVLVDDTGTVADVNGATNTWWRASDVASGSFAARGVADLRNLRDLLLQAGQNGAPMPDAIFTTRLVYELYEASQATGIRYESRQTADGTFSDLKWSGATVQFDPNIATGELYMLSSEALQFVVHSDADWTLGNPIEPSDQDARVMKLIWMGNLVCLNRRRLGRLTGITA